MTQINPMEIYAYARQGGVEGREEAKRSRLASLLGQAYGAPQEQRSKLLGQAATIDPMATANHQKFLGGMDDDRRAKIARQAQIFDTLPDEQKAAMYPQLAREVGALTGMPIPEQYDPKFLPAIQRVASWQGGSGQNLVQSRFVGEDGQVYAMMRDGSLQATGVKADRQMWFRDHPGMAPELVGKDGTVRPVGQAPMGQMPQRAQGEVPFSIDPSLPPEVQAAIRANESQFASAPNGATMNLGGPPAMPAQARPSEAQTAAQVEAAKQSTALQYLPHVESIKAQAAINQAAGTEQAKSAVERQSTARTKSPQVANVMRGLDRIDAALKGLEGGMVDTGPVDQFAVKFLPSGQELERAVGAIQNDMLALTRVPGVGSQSDLEAKIAALKWPSLGNHPEVNARNVAQLRAFMRDLEASLGIATRSGDTGPSNSVGGAGNTGKVARPQSQADFDALPSGAIYIDPDDGKTYRKD